MRGFFVVCCPFWEVDVLVPIMEAVKAMLMDWFEAKGVICVDSVIATTLGSLPTPTPAVPTPPPVAVADPDEVMGTRT